MNSISREEPKRLVDEKFKPMYQFREDHLWTEEGYSGSWDFSIFGFFDVA